MYDAMISGINGLGETASGIVKQQSELKDAAARQKLMGQESQLNDQKLAVNKETAAQAFAKKQLLGSIESSGELSPKAMMGTPTADGNAVDFQAVKQSREYDQAAKAWNQFHQGDPDFVPASGDKLRKEADARALSRNKADNDQIPIEQMAKETHASKMANEKSARESGRYTPINLEGGGIGRFNTKSGTVEDTGKTGSQKTGGVGRLEIIKAGSTLIPDLQPIEGAQITKESVSKVKAAAAATLDLENKVNAYEALINKYGGEAVGQKADELAAAHTAIGMTLKTLNGLGVLSKSDWELTLKQVPTASGIGASMKDKLYGAVGQNAFKPGLQVLKNNVASQFESFSRVNGFEKAANPAAPTTPGSHDHLSDDDLDAQLRAKGIDPLTGKPLKGGANGAF